MGSYVIPKEISDKFTNRFLEYFNSELCKIWKEKVDTWDGTVFPFIEGTQGWALAFERSLIDFDMLDVWTYYSSLEWYDSDQFDGQLGDMLEVFIKSKAN